MYYLQISRLVRKGLYGIRWYLYALLPFFAFFGFAAWYRHRLVLGETNPDYINFTMEELMYMPAMFFWVGVIISGTLMAIIAINDLVDVIEKLTSKKR